MSARSASEPAPAPAELASRVRVPGTARTYEVREQLRGLGLRWDPATHAWHGTIRAGEEVVLERELRVRPQVVHPIEAFAAEAASSPPAGPKPPDPGPHAAGDPRRPPGDGSRTRAEARTAYRDVNEEGDRPIQPRFSVRDVTSGLADDSLEADDRANARRIAELRGRVKAARAALAAAPQFAEMLCADWRREVALYLRLGITQAQFRHGVPSVVSDGADDPVDALGSSVDPRAEASARAAAVFPGPEGTVG